MCFTGTVSRWNQSQFRGTDTDRKPNGSLGTLLFEAQQMLSDDKVNWNYSFERLVSHLGDKLFIVKDGRQSQLLGLFLVAKASPRQSGQSPVREEEKCMRRCGLFHHHWDQRRKLLFNVLYTLNRLFSKMLYFPSTVISTASRCVGKFWT